jgi:sulfur-carrier protein adenylyltransferase/sulfurtransferase
MSWIDVLRSEIEQLSAQDAQEAHNSGSLLIDVRTPKEFALGAAEGAINCPRDALELSLQRITTDLERPLILMCASGTRSLLAAANLKQMGYRSVRSLTGGLDAWKAGGLASSRPADPAPSDRYARHLAMPNVGPIGQSALGRAKVLVAGVGGLGSPAALYLAAAGVGNIGLIDDDRVDLTNLQRQILHSEATQGWPKVASGVERIRGLNSEINVIPHFSRVSPDTIDEVLQGYDIVIDGTDNFEARYLLSEASRRGGQTYIYGAVFQFEGQLAVFRPNGACFRCYQPSAPPNEVAPTCAEAGVLGVLPGIIGSLQALEAIKHILGLGEGEEPRLLHFDALGSRFAGFQIPVDPTCPGPH